MGISSGASSSVSGVTAEINVTPMADIMLVLLIIFMLTTPLLQKGITVNLPKARNVIEMPEAENRDALVVGMDRMMHLYFGNKPYDKATLKDRIAAAKEIKMNDKIWFKCDKSVEYEKVVEILDMIHELGFDHIGLLVDQKK